MSSGFKCPVCRKEVYSELGKSCMMCGMVLHDEGKEFCSRGCRTTYEIRGSARAHEAFGLIVKKVLRTRGMHCRSCEALLREALGELAGVKRVDANAARNEVVVEFDSGVLGLNEVRKAIEREGYKVREVVE